MSPQIPIPDDWPIETYHCVQIRWPDSPKWNAILAGLILTPSRGRFWDKRTGSIWAAQDIGHEIDSLNFPMNACGSEVSPVIDAEFLATLNISESEELCSMGCSIPYGSLRWSGGKLQYINCGVWYDVEGNPAIDLPIGDEYVPPEIDAGGYSACGKAEGVMSLVNQVITSLLDEIGNFSWQWWGHVKADCPGVGMDAKWIISAIQAAVNWEAADSLAGPSYDPDAMDESTWQSVKCHLARDFSAVMPEDLNGNDIRSKLQDYFASEFGWDVLTNAIFVDCLRGINRESFEDAMKAGASYDSSDCDCPGFDDEPVYPTEGDWYLGEKRTVTFNFDDVKENSYTHICIVPEHDVYGLFSWADVNSIDGTLARWAKGPTFGGCSHDVMLTNHGSTHSMAETEMDVQMEDTPATTLYDAMTTEKTKELSALGLMSKVVVSPVADGGETIQVMFFAVASAAGSGNITIEYRLVHNSGSASHS